MLQRTFEALEGSEKDTGNLIVDVKDYYHVLNKEETNLLFTNLDHVFARVILLEVNTKKLRKKIAKRGSINKGSTQRMSMLDDLSAKLEINSSNMMTQEDLLSSSGHKDSQVEFENSYLLTELDSSRPESPNGSNSLNTSSLGLGNGGRRRRALKSESLKLSEKNIRQLESD